MFYNFLLKRNFQKIFKITKVTNLRNFSITTKNVDINSLGIINPQVIHHNLSYPELNQHEKIN